MYLWDLLVFRFQHSIFANKYVCVLVEVQVWKQIKTVKMQSSKYRGEIMNIKDKSKETQNMV